MIIDTTYLLPLTGIGIDTDLLNKIDDGKLGINMEELGISLISLFEIQAKSARLNITPDLTEKAIFAINEKFRVQPFYNGDVIKISYMLKSMMKDYIDCIILATAIATKEDLVTEDSLLLGMKKLVKEKFGINIFSYADLVSQFRIF